MKTVIEVLPFIAWILSGVSMLAYVFHIPELLKFGSFPPMKLAVCLAIFLASPLTILIRGNGIGHRSQVLGAALVQSLFILMGTIILAHIFGVDSGMENIFGTKFSSSIMGGDSRPSIVTAIALTLIAFAGLAWIFEMRHLVRGLYFLAGGLAVPPILGFFLGNPLLYYSVSGKQSGISPVGAICLLLLGIAGADRIVEQALKHESSACEDCEECGRS